MWLHFEEVARLRIGASPFVRRARTTEGGHVTRQNSGSDGESSPNINSACLVAVSLLDWRVARRESYRAGEGDEG